MFRRARHFETQFDSFANALRDLVQRPRLRMASGDLWDRGDIIAFLITFNNDIELALQRGVLAFNSRLFRCRERDRTHIRP